MNQLNPHFTFNAINVMGKTVIEGKNVEAYEYFAKHSALFRESMKNALHPFKTLEEETAFVRGSILRSRDIVSMISLIGISALIRQSIRS